MDHEIIRFKIDPSIRNKAAEVCAGLGHELNDVLRTVVTRIAQEGSLPFSMGLVAREPAPGKVPFADYDERLWAPLKPQVDAEIAIALLARFIADCSTRIDELADTAEPQAARLGRQRDEACRLRRGLDVADAEAVRRVIHRYGSA